MALKTSAASLLLCALALSPLSMAYAEVLAIRHHPGMVMEQKSNGALRDASNRILGNIDSDGTVRDASNRILGKIDNSNTVRDANNRILGSIDDDGTVRDASNRIIASASAARADWIAAVVFFFPDSLLP